MKTYIKEIIQSFKTFHKKFILFFITILFLFISIHAHSFSNLYGGEERSVDDIDDRMWIVLRLGCPYCNYLLESMLELCDDGRHGFEPDKIGFLVVGDKDGLRDLFDHNPGYNRYKDKDKYENKNKYEIIHMSNRESMSLGHRAVPALFFNTSKGEEIAHGSGVIFDLLSKLDGGENSICSEAEF